MVYIEWSKEMETGIGAIDAQHKTLVQMMNDIAAALEGSNPAGTEKAIEANLQKLLNYTVDHFSLEESFMQESGFEGYEEHKKVHDDFREMMLDLFARFRRGEDVAHQLLGELRVWLVHHIQGSDMQFVEAFRAKLPVARLENAPPWSN